jgi:hypothetical protein
VSLGFVADRVGERGVGVHGAIRVNARVARYELLPGGTQQHLNECAVLEGRGEGGRGERGEGLN